jgi:hypothetical protein
MSSIRKIERRSLEIALAPAAAAIDSHRLKVSLSHAKAVV